MPLGGLLPYGGMSEMFGELPPETFPGAAGVNAPTSPGMGSQLMDLLPQLLMAFSAGQAIRQRDPGALSDVVGTFASGLEQRRRGKLAEEAQRLREERERRMAEDANAREERLVGVAERTGERETAQAERQRLADLNALINSISDDTRGMMGGNAPVAGPALEDYMTAQSGRVAPLGGDPNAVRQLIMSMATQLSQQKPDVPIVELAPGKPPTKVGMTPPGSIVRNAPQPRVGREAPLPARTWAEVADDPNREEMVLTDPRTGKTISRTGQFRRRGRVDPMDDIVQQVLGSRGSTAPKAAPTAAAPKIGTRRKIDGVLVEWGQLPGEAGPGWIPVK